MTAVRRLCAMSAAVCSRTTLTPRRAAKRSMSSRSPVRNVQMSGLRPDLLCVRPQYRRLVVGRIERDRHELHAAVERSVLTNRLLDRGEVTIHQRAEGRDRAARVNEGQGDRAAPPVGQPARSAALVDERLIGNGLAGLQQLESGSSRGGGRRRRQLREPDLPDASKRGLTIRQHERWLRSDHRAHARPAPRGPRP